MNYNDTNMNGVNGGGNPNQPGITPNPDFSNSNGSLPSSGGLQGVSLGSMNMGAPIGGGIDPVNQQPNNLNQGVDMNGNFSQNSMMNSSMVTPQSNVNPMDMSGQQNLLTPNSGNLGTNPFSNPVNSMDGSGMISNNMGQVPTVDGVGTVSPNPMNVNPSMDFNANMTNAPMGVNNGMQQQNNNFNPNPFSPTGMDPNNQLGTPNMLGAVPTPPVMGPQNGKQKKEKKPLSKTTIILMAVLLILVIGCGVYFVLNGSKANVSKVSIVANDMFLDLGKPLSTKIADYGSVQGYDINNCTLDTSKVDLTKMGSYEYKITCGPTVKTGTIVLQDNVAPEVTVREVMVVPGAALKLEDFIVSCEDFTSCSYELADSTQDLDTLTETEGTYEVEILVSDEYENQKKVVATLVVSLNAPVKFMYCTPTSLPNNTLNADLDVSYSYGISTDGELVRTQKISTYTFKEETEYKTIKTGYTPSTGINGMIGEAEFDDDNFVIKLTQVLTTDELATEFNVNPFPTVYEELKEFHINQGISCKNR